MKVVKNLTDTCDEIPAPDISKDRPILYKTASNSCPLNSTMDLSYQECEALYISRILINSLQ